MDALVAAVVAQDLQQQLRSQAGTGLRLDGGGLLLRQVLLLCLCGRLEGDGGKLSTQEPQPPSQVLPRNQVDLVENQHEAFALGLHKLLQLRAARAERVPGIKNLQHDIGAFHDLAQLLVAGPVGQLLQHVLLARLFQMLPQHAADGQSLVLCLTPAGVSLQLPKVPVLVLLLLPGLLLALLMLFPHPLLQLCLLQQLALERQAVGDARVLGLVFVRVFLGFPPFLL